jgi:hypothetical protein
VQLGMRASGWIAGSGWDVYPVRVLCVSRCTVHRIGWLVPMGTGELHDPRGCIAGIESFTFLWYHPLRVVDIVGKMGRGRGRENRTKGGIFICTPYVRTRWAYPLAAHAYVSTQI